MLNKITLIGRLTRDVESGATQNGVSFARFSLAVQRDFANANGVKEADFINCVAWRGAAEVISKYVKKGDLFAVTGRLQQQSYQDQTGNKRTTFNVVVEDFQFLGGNNQSQNNTNNNGYQNNQGFNSNSTNSSNFNKSSQSEEDLLNDFESGFNLDDDVPF